MTRMLIVDSGDHLIRFRGLPETQHPRDQVYPLEWSKARLKIRFWYPLDRNTDLWILLLKKKKIRELYFEAY
jgi:hypothetical protein